MFSDQIVNHNIEIQHIMKLKEGDNLQKYHIFKQTVQWKR